MWRRSMLLVAAAAEAAVVAAAVQRPAMARAAQMRGALASRSLHDRAAYKSALRRTLIDHHGHAAVSIRANMHRRAASSHTDASGRAPPPKAEMPSSDGSGSFRSLVDYPCTMRIKVIGFNEGAFVADMRSLCAGITGQQEEDVEVTWRDKGKYRAVTLGLRFDNADQVYAVYAAVDADARVKYKL